MKILYNITAFACLIIVIGVIAACTETENDHYVVIISIDGFPADALWDERIPVPTIRTLAEEGAWAKAMIPSTPTVTWPNHTTLTTGVHPAKHGMVTNGLFIRSGPGEPIYREPDLDREELSTYPTLYDVAYEAGMRTAEVNWPVTRNANTLHDSFPDAVAEITNTTPRLRSELVELGLIEEETDEAFQLGPVARDYVWTKATTHLIRSRQPHILLLHLLNVDGTHHGHGAKTNPGNTALAYADANVRTVVETIEKAGIREQTTIMVVSDHGFMNVTQRIEPNVLLRQNGLLDVDEDGNITSVRVQAVSNGGTAMVFATDPSTKNEDLELARSLFEGAAGIARVIGPDEFEVYGMPHPSENEHMGDLVLGADEGHSFGNSAAGDELVVSLDATIGVHGYFSDVPQMETIFIASGRGIRAGIELDIIDNRSVAPTAAELLGLSMDQADGNILNEILE